MKNLQILSLALLCILISVTSCRKYDQGPQGIKGEQGPPGPKGEPGPKGDPGEESAGISNVIYSDWALLPFALQSNGYWRTTWNVDRVTPEILSKGSVIIYMKRNGSVYKLDYYTNTESFTQRLDVGEIWLYGSFDPAAVQFRYIIIPGSESAAASISSAKTGLPDWNDYSAVCKYYGIEE